MNRILKNALFLQEDAMATRRTIIECATLTLAGFIFSLIFVGVGTDDAWSLQVLRRMQNGEALYRDIFFGALPLSLYLTLPLVKVLGAELFVIKLSVALCAALTYQTACRLAEDLTNTKRYHGFLTIILLLVNGWQTALYQPLATLFCLLSWRALHTDDRRGICLAAFWAGCAGATKQNFGFYLLAALWLVLLARHGLARERHPSFVKHWLSDVTLVSGICLLVIGVTLLPLVWQGGWTQFWDFAFFNKRTYLRAAELSYWSGLRSFVETLWSPWSKETPYQLAVFQFYALPLAALACLAMIARRAFLADQLRWVRLAVFVLVAFAGMFPRVDITHIAYVAPSFLLALLYFWQRWQDSSPTRTTAFFSWALGLTLWLCLFGWFASGAYKLLQQPVRLSPLPHFQYVVLPTREWQAREKLAAALQRRGLSEPLFLATWQAGFYYLAAELQNPTPYDYPIVTAFGSRGQAATIEALAQKRIRLVCLKQMEGSLAAVALENYVIENLDYESELEGCTLFRVRP